jgi:hypothetical protein
MKNRVGLVVASLLLGVLTLGSTALAQRIERTVKANIPFDFVLGRESFPAGRYSVVIKTSGLLELRDSEGRVLANVLTQPVQGPGDPARPRLRFDSEGGHHLLTQVWQQGDEIGQQILQPKSPSLAVRKRSRRVQTAEVGNPR